MSIFNLENYIVKRLPQDSLPYVLKRKRIYILPSKIGIVLFLAIFLMFLSSINSSNNLGFLFTFFLVGIFLISIFHTFMNLFDLRIKSIQTKPVFAGEDARFDVVIEGQRSYWNLGFKNKTNKEVYCQHVDDNSKKIGLLQNMPKRGVYQLNKIKVFTYYPLGFFKAWSYLKPEINQIVYPKPLEKIPNYVSKGKENDPNGSEVSYVGNKEDISHLNTYTAGDALSLVHWKALAKGQGMYTKVFSSLGTASYHFDIKELPKERDLEYKLSYLCTLIKQAENLKQDYSLSLLEEQIEVGSGSLHYHRCLTALANVNPLSEKTNNVWV